MMTTTTTMSSRCSSSSSSFSRLTRMSRRKTALKSVVTMRNCIAKKRDDKDKNYPNLYTPQDGELAERKAARTLKRLFTYVAIRVVQAHLEGAGNDGGFAPQVTGYDGKVQCPDYNDLRNAMEGIELGDGDSWIREFAKVNPAVTLRILEARKAYREEFDYDMLESFVDDDIVKANTELMTEIMNRSLEREAEKED